MYSLLDNKKEMFFVVYKAMELFRRVTSTYTNGFRGRLRDFTAIIISMAFIQNIQRFWHSHLYNEKTFILHSIFGTSHKHYKMCRTMTRKSSYLWSLLPEIYFVKNNHFSKCLFITPPHFQFMSFPYMDHDGKKTLPVCQYLESLAPYVL